MRRKTKSKHKLRARFFGFYDLRFTAYALQFTLNENWWRGIFFTPPVKLFAPCSRLHLRLPRNFVPRNDNAEGCEQVYLGTWNSKL